MDLAAAKQLILDKYTAIRLPASQLKSYPLSGRAYGHISPPCECECWRAPTGFLTFVCEDLFLTVNSLSTQVRVATSLFGENVQRIPVRKSSRPNADQQRLIRALSDRRGYRAKRKRRLLRQRDANSSDITNGKKTTH
jgi:hypothetical protein